VPPRANRIGAAVVALLMVGSLARSFLRPPPADAGAQPSAEGAPPPAAAPSGARARLDVRLDFEVQAEMAPGETPPPLRLRLRTRDGVQQPFDVTTRDEPVRARFTLPVALPVAHPELPLRGEIVGDTWCIPPGVIEFEVRRLDAPYQLTLARGRARDVAVATEEGRALAGVRIVHESARAVGTTAADGRARLVLAVARQAPVLIAQADGFAPAWVDEAAPTVLRSTKTIGRLRGVVRDAQGGAVANASLFPHWSPAGDPPADAAGRALDRLARFTAKRNVPALALTSDPDGRFELAVAAAGSVTFSVQQRDFGATRATFELGADAAAAGASTDVEIRFPRRVPIAVALTLDGAPLARGRVEVVRSEQGETTTLAAAVADSQGKLEIVAPDLPPLFLVAHGDGTATRVEPLAMTRGTADAVELALERGRAATFTLVASGDLPVEGQRVDARDRESGVLLESVPADRSGRGRFRRLPTGRALDLFAPRPGASAPLRAALVVGADEGDLDLGTFELGPH
jgi:hypothetical protein